ncbi:transposase [Streptomyces sp. HUAS TT3]|uniref:transposase n=1 Tax=Streptomyces sp. HUAS TT3 TaxID=3447510 RepID=UPI003F65B7C4
MTELTEKTAAAHEQSLGTYGAPRVHAVSHRDGAGCGRREVARLMRPAGGGAAPQTPAPHHDPRPARGHPPRPGASRVPS